MSARTRSSFVLLRGKKSRRTDTNEAGRTTEVTDGVLHTLRTLARLADEIAQDTGVPGLSAGISVVSELLEKIQTTKKNVRGVTTLGTRLEALLATLNGFQTRPGTSNVAESTRERVEVLTQKWTTVGEDLAILKSRNCLLRFIRSDVDAEALTELVEDINVSIQNFLLGGALFVEENIHYIRQGVENMDAAVAVTQAHVAAVHGDVRHVQSSVAEVQLGVGVVHADIERVQAGVEGVQRTIGRVEMKLRNRDAFQSDSLLPRGTTNARYDASNVRKPCLEGTRVDALRQLFDWIVATCTPIKNLSGHAKSLFWINGLAGTGKTAVAYTVAKWCDERGILGASFFCSRSDSECSDPNLIFTTISRQLCLYHPPFKEKVDALLRADPDIVHAGAARQFEELILHPLEATKDTFPKAIIVIDALDECQDHNPKLTILSVLAKFFPRIAPFISFIITSRPESRIAALFSPSHANNLGDVAISLSLHLIKPELVSADIRRYLKHSFGEHAGVFEVEYDWPSAEDVERLVELSRGLFIFASTAMLFIMDVDYSDPQGQLRSLIDAQSAATPSKTLLNSLYSQIALSAFSKISSSLQDRLQPILSALALAEEPLSTATLANMLGQSESVVRNTLIGLRSVLHIPADNKDFISVIHPTFPEFLTQPSPEFPKPSAFCIDSAEQHGFLFVRQLEVMRLLKRNIANLRDPASFKTEIPNFADIVIKSIPAHLSYACRHWSTHLRKCHGADRVKSAYTQFHEFLLHRLLYWIEACSLLGALEDTIIGLENTCRVCEDLGEPFKNFVPLLVDCRRFALSYPACIDLSPLQVYHSALGLAPSTSLVKQAYARELEHSVVVHSGGLDYWGSCLDIFTGPGDDEICSVAFAPDGSTFAIGGMERTINVRKASTRTLQICLEGYRDTVTCIAYSPDAQLLAAGTLGGGVDLRRIGTGERLHNLHGHEDDVESVAYHVGGKHILSVTFHGNVRMWDTSDGHCLLNLQVHSDTEVALAPDGTALAYGHRGNLRLCRVLSRSYEDLHLPDYRGESVVFSPDGHYIVTRGYDTIRVWNLADKSLVYSVGAAPGLCRLALSNGRARVAGGYSDGSVHVWDIRSNDPPRILSEATAYWVPDIAWSPDDSQLVSVSCNGTVRVWDTSYTPIIHEPIHPSEHNSIHPDLPRFAVISIRKMPAFILHLPSLSIDANHLSRSFHALEDPPALAFHRTFEDAWNGLAPVLSRELQGFSNTFDWAFSTATGQRHISFGVGALSFTEDGTSMTYPRHRIDGGNNLDVLDLLTGVATVMVTGHTDAICSTAFSPDGTLLATGSKDETVKIWSVASDTLVCGHGEHSGWVTAITFSLDGRFVVSGSNDETVRMFEIATERILRVFESPQLSLSPLVRILVGTDNRHVLSQNDHGRLHIWDVEHDALVYAVSRENVGEWISSLNFSPDDTGILPSGGGEGPAISLWQPGDRSLPVYNVTKDGWVYAKGPGRSSRLCWLPPEWRTTLASDGSMFYVLDKDKQSVITLDLSRVLECVDRLDTRKNPSTLAALH